GDLCLFKFRYRPAHGVKELTFRSSRILPVNKNKFDPVPVKLLSHDQLVHQLSTQTVRIQTHHFRDETLSHILPQSGQSRTVQKLPRNSLVDIFDRVVVPAFFRHSRIWSRMLYPRWEDSSVDTRQ